MNSDERKWNWAGEKTCVDKFPNFKKWFEDITKVNWPKIGKIEITKYKRFIIKIDDKGNLLVTAFEGSLTKEENESFWKDPHFSLFIS